VYYSCTKFRHYLLNAECTVYSKFDVIKHMLSMPILNGRIGKWILALSEFELKFESAKAIKGQIIADFITEHRDPSIDLLEITPWALFFNGSSCGKGGGVAILLISPRGEMFEFAIPIQPTVTNNQAKYEALLRGLQYLREAGAVSCSRDTATQCSGRRHWMNNSQRPGSTPPCSSRSLTPPLPNTITKSRTCRRRVTSWCGRSSRSATRTKVRCCLVDYPLEVSCSGLIPPC
jgi:ribonuclease HI